MLDNFSARAFPPFIPPNLPSATAAGFFSLAGAGSSIFTGDSCPVDMATMYAAN